MKYYGKAKIKEIQERDLEYMRCDKCNKKINFYNDYYWITTGHGDWGNDSVDSIEHYDICKDCVNDFIIDYMNSNRMQNSNTAYIEVESEICTKNGHHYDDCEDELVEDDCCVE